MEVVTKSAKETQKLGEKIGRDLKKGAVVALYGELGSGKTTFIQGLARGLGIKRRVISPTFVFIRQYLITNHPRPRLRLAEGGQSPITFYHVDLYRVEKYKDTKGLGLEEIFADKNAVVAIEWAEKIKKILPKKRIDVYFEYVSENKRKIHISSY